MKVSLVTNILKANERIAEQNKQLSEKSTKCQKSSGRQFHMKTMKRRIGFQLAEIITECGLGNVFVEDFNDFVCKRWELTRIRRAMISKSHLICVSNHPKTHSHWLRPARCWNLPQGRWPDRWCADHGIPQYSGRRRHPRRRRRWYLFLGSPWQIRP